MTKPTISIIISRYNEDLKWTLEEPFNQFKYIVYNKGDNELFEKTAVLQIINLPNVGRESHTYLHHIISNYDNLSDIVVFLPGSTNLSHKKRKATMILWKIIATNQAHFIGLYGKSVKNTFRNFYINDWICSSAKNFQKNPESRLEQCTIKPYGNWYSHFFGDKQAHWVTWCGIFSVDKRDVLRNGINRYKTLITTVSDHSNPEANHYLERSWGVIFAPFLHTVCLREA